MVARRTVRAVKEPAELPARPVGRPCKLTPDVQARICAVLAVGGTYKLAAIAGGVSQSGLRSWLERGRRVLEWAERREADGEPADIAEDDRPYAELVQATDKAMLTPALVALQAIQTAAKDGDWRAGLAWLERRYPRDFGAQLTQKIDAAGDGQMRITIVHSDWWRGADILGDPEPEGELHKSPEFATREELDAWMREHGPKRNNRHETIALTAPDPESPGGERVVASTTLSRRRQDTPAGRQVAAEPEGLQRHTATPQPAPAPAPVQRDVQPQAEAAQATPEAERPGAPVRSPYRRNWYDRTR